MRDLEANRRIQFVRRKLVCNGRLMEGERSFYRSRLPGVQGGTELP